MLTVSSPTSAIHCVLRHVCTKMCETIVSGQGGLAYVLFCICVVLDRERERERRTHTKLVVGSRADTKANAAMTKNTTSQGGRLDLRSSLRFGGDKIALASGENLFEAGRSERERPQPNATTTTTTTTTTTNDNDNDNNNDNNN